MRLINWLKSIQLGRVSGRYGNRRRKTADVLHAASCELVTHSEALEDRCLLASDFGDAPDTAAGTGTGNYETLQANGGASHTIDTSQTTLFLGDSVDGDDGTLQNSRANADDVDGALPDDEDGVLSPFTDLRGTVGAQPKVTLLATNTTGGTAKLSGWIDYNNDGVFDNNTERVQADVPNSTTDGRFSLTFPVIPNGFTGTTYARFRLSTDATAEDSTGAASDGEVEDYSFAITSPNGGNIKQTAEINSSTTNGPALDNLDQFGLSVTSVGDLDGDGVADLAVGASGDAGGGSDRGAVHVLLLNADGSVKQTVEINDSTANGPVLSDNDFFGRSVTSVGDLDGDGVPDLAVGAFGDDEGGSYRGAVHILLLNNDGSVKQTAEINSSTPNGPVLSDNDSFGFSVTSVGDLDGDGVPDLAVGAYRDDEGGSGRGAVHILMLNTDGSVKQTVEINSSTTNGPVLSEDNDFFGTSVTSLGDLDGDGVPDLAVGARGDGEGGTYRGAVHVLMLNADGSVKQTVEINDGTANGPVLNDDDWFGFSVTSVGDLDGDGVPDLAVGTPKDDEGGDNRGALHVLLLNANGSVKQTVEINSSTANGPTLSDGDTFGSSVTSMGDLDGDGVPDLAVGAYGDAEGGSYRGAVHILMLAPPPMVDYGDAPDKGAGTGMGNYQTTAADGGPSHAVVAGLFLGDSVDGGEDGSLQNVRANADDVNGALPDDEDGVLSPFTDLRGTVGAQPKVTLLVTNTTGSTAKLSGWIDYNNDGVFDNATERNQVDVPDGTTDGRFTLTFPAIPAGSAGSTYARFRLSTDTAGESSIGAATDGEVEDYTFTITSVTTGLPKSSVAIHSSTPNGPVLTDNDQFGSSAASLGDLDGDGVADLAVGARYDDTGGTDSGVVHVLFLNTDGSVKSTVEINSTSTNGPTLNAGDFFGEDVANVGDIDGDGVTDLAVGASGDDGPAGDRVGAVHILLLNDDGTVKSTAEISGNTANGPVLDHPQSFGSSVTSVGDLNGDGVPDLAVGAQSNSEIGSEDGAVHVLFLNSNATVKSSAKINAATTNGPTLSDFDRFGSSVVSPGDLNGDGVSDLAVGANNSSSEFNIAGAVHILLLNDDGTVKSTTELNANSANAPVLAAGHRFGSSLAATGDLDGDGVPDLAVGTPGTETASDKFGAIHILLLKTDGSIKSSVEINSNTSDGPDLTGVSSLGSALASLGDLNGDGVPDLAVGAETDETGGFNRGAVHIVSLASPDSTPPTVTSIVRQAPTAEVTNAAEVTFRVTFSEDTANIGAADFALSGTAAGDGRIGAPTAVTSSSVFDVTVTGLASSNGTIDLGFASGQNITDAAGNALTNTTPGSEETYTIDNTAPTVSSIALVGTSPISASSVDYTVTFSEVVMGVGPNDFLGVDNSGTLNPSVSAVSGNGAVYTVTVDFGASGVGFTNFTSLTFDADADAGVTDAAGNVSTADFAGASIEVDNTGPAPSISAMQSSPTNASPINVTVAFDEDVTGFDINDVSVGNGSAGNFAIVNNRTFTLDVTPNGSAVTVDVGANVAQDGAGNNNTAAEQFSITSDRTAPTATISDVTPNLRQSDAGTLTITFSEDVTGVDIADFGLTRDSTGSPQDVGLSGLTVTGSGSSYSLDLSSVTNEQGANVLTLHPNDTGTVIRDEAGNAFDTAVTTSWTFAAAGGQTSGGAATVGDVGGSSDEVLTVAVSGSSTQLNDAVNTLAAGAGTTQVNENTIRFDTALTSMVIDGGNGNDSLTVDLREGNPVPNGTITFNGGAGGMDSLTVLDSNGNQISAGIYQPDMSSATDGTVTVTAADGSTLTIVFTGLEPVTLANMTLAEFESLRSSDNITLNSTTSGSVPAVIVGGTSDGTPFETATVFDSATLEIDLGTNDGASPNDTLTISGGLDQTSGGAHGLQNVIINGGAGENTVVLDSDINLPGTATLSNVAITGTGRIFGPLVIGGGSSLAVGGTGTRQFPTGALTVSPTATLIIDINGTTPGTEHDQLQVTGTVDVTGATLDVTSTATLGSGDSIVLIDNDGTADAVTGTFAGLAEGDIITANGQALVISYVGGDGNDITLSPVGVEFSAAGFTRSEVGTGDTITLTRNTSAGTAVVQVTFTGGTATAGSDYTATPIDVTFNDGETSATVDVPILNDRIVEADETVNMSVAATSGTLIGSPSTAVLTIQNEDQLPLIVVGNDGPTSPVARIVDPATGQETMRIDTLDPDFQGGVRTAAADVNNDGVDDIIIAAGPGGGPRVQVFDGANGNKLQDFFAYHKGFRGGVFVAAGDVDGDGDVDIITGADAGGGPHVRAFDITSLDRVKDFFPFSPNFTGGVRVASGDVNNDGVDDIIASSGAGASPHVVVVSGRDDSSLMSFNAYNPTWHGGTYVAAGDINGDGYADVITGAGATGGPHVRAWSGADSTRIASFFAYGHGNRDGIRVAASDVTGDGLADILINPATGRANAPIGFDSGNNFAPTNGGLAIADLGFGFYASAPTLRSPSANIPPEVAHTIQDQTATTGASFSFTVPADTFRDRDRNDVLAYSAALPSGGSLPGWLSFDANTQTFTGTPAAPGDVGTRTVRVTVDDNMSGTASDDFDLTVRDGSAPPASSGQIVIGAGQGQRSWVQVIDASTGNEVRRFRAYHSAFRGGVDVALADVNKDGTDDIITGAGPGGGPHVKVFDGATGDTLQSFFPFNVNFTGGVHVAGADVNGDGYDDVITGAGPGGAPTVRVFSGKDMTPLHTFNAYSTRFFGGVDVAGGDVTGDGKADIITGAGPGGGPHVIVFDGVTGRPVHSFFAFSPSFGGGVSVSAGDVNGDGMADVITGQATGGGEVRVFDSVDASRIRRATPFGSDFDGGVNVGSTNADNDIYEDVVVGEAGGNRVETLDGEDLTELDDFFAFDPTFTGGALVD